MLVLSRKSSERILIGPSIVLTVVRIEGSTVRLGIEAPPEVSILRQELEAQPGARPGGPRGG
jgi:carbon storage regulator